MLNVAYAKCCKKPFILSVVMLNVVMMKVVPTHLKIIVRSSCKTYRLVPYHNKLECISVSVTSAIILYFQARLESFSQSGAYLAHG